MVHRELSNLYKAFIRVLVNREDLLIKEENDAADASAVAMVLAQTTVNQMTLQKALTLSKCQLTHP